MKLSLSPKQIEAVANSDARINLLNGAIRSGKTVASACRLLADIAAIPAGANGEILIVGKTLQSIDRNIFSVLKDRSLFGPVADHVSYTAGASTGWILGKRVHVVGASDAKAEAKIRGMTVRLAYIDEATLLPRDFFNQLLGRMSVKGAKLIATTNPDSPGHWLRKDFMLNEKLDMNTFFFTLDDNEHLDPEYVRNLKEEYTGLWYRRFIEGEWVSAEGAIYDMFDEEKHVVDELPVITRFLAVGFDYGTTNATAGVALGIGADGVLYVFDEWFYDGRKEKHSLTDVEYAERITGWLDGMAEYPEYLVLDPSAASFKAQLRRDGVHVQPAFNDVLDGIRTVASLFAKGLLKVHSSCKNLIEELPGYSWDEKAALAGEDKPVKVNDHSCDALRYAVYTTAKLWRNAIDI
ncbi:PBSX family phage terminase large subunit [Streptomyces phaeochromogenes]|uniref:PBSX family phage terminase large subunit n=1 Tax=Streptomyces phaeochromogenes TaxID=1923 RepID=UPI002E2CCB5E|nr:PBSX family phage terminase large subunit [Streptomyces phaeochromogenes]